MSASQLALAQQMMSGGGKGMPKMGGRALRRAMARKKGAIDTGSIMEGLRSRMSGGIEDDDSDLSPEQRREMIRRRVRKMKNQRTSRLVVAKREQERRERMRENDEKRRLKYELEKLIEERAHQKMTRMMDMIEGAIGTVSIEKYQEALERLNQAEAQAALKLEKEAPIPEHKNRDLILVRLYERQQSMTGKIDLESAEADLFG